jgi:putative phage-type endonuclease
MMTLTKTQLEERLGMVTGSDAGAIEGTSPYTSVYQAWAKKTRRVVDTFSGNNKTELGTWLEAFAVKKYEEHSGKKCRMVHRTLRHKRYPFIGGHIDRLVEGDPNRGVECKAVTSDGMGKWFDEADELMVPAYYVSQVKHYALVTGRMSWDFAVVFTDGRRDPFFTTIEFSQGDLDLYLERCIAFWSYVDSDSPPDVDDSDATAATLKQEWRDSDPGLVKVAPDFVMKYLSERSSNKEMKEVYTAQMQLMENRLRKFLEEADTIVSPKGEVLCTWKQTKKGDRRFNFNFKREQMNAEK